MTSFLLVVSWIVWAFFSLFGISLLRSQSDDSGVRAMMKFQGLVILIGCVITAIFPISKFHLVWWFVVAYFTPMVLMGFRGVSVDRKFAELKEESARTGIPFIDLIQRENKKMENTHHDP
jgi:Na+/serine symporter